MAMAASTALPAHTSRLASSSIAAYSGRPFSDSSHLLISAPSVPLAKRRCFVSCSATQEKATQEKDTPKDTPEEVTRKFGLEAGLWKIFTSKDDKGDKVGEKRGIQAKELLTRYGGAYLATSISLSLISFGLCYVLISAGVDVASLLEKVGIQANETGEKVGTFALAYAAHKAASPIRFPPTVALTPIVAGWFGKKAEEIKEDKDS